MGTYGDGSDGELIFTSGTKSYGNLVENTDYKVLDNTLYLKTDRVFNFTNFTIGSGIDYVAPFFPNDSGTSVYIKCTGTATIAGSCLMDFGNGVNNSGDGIRGGEVSTTWATGEDEGTLSTPGVANAGSGGNGGGTSSSTQGSNSGGDGKGQSNGWPGGGGGGAAVADSYGGGSGGYASAGRKNLRNDAEGRDESDYSGFDSSGQLSGEGSDVQTTEGSEGGGGALCWFSARNFSISSGGPVDTRGGNGENGQIIDGGDGDYEEGCGGGGGNGGSAGYSGIHFILKAPIINFTGTIQSSGYDGTAGGNGGNGAVSRSGEAGAAGGGGGGAGGGGGGNAGDIKFVYAGSLTDTGTKTMDAGSGGNGGTGGTGASSGNCTGSSGGNGTSGTAGTAGSFTSEQVAIYKINIGDSWKDIVGSKINIGDSWKTVNNIKINIGDSWKTIG